jgi:hypothetical protein
VCEAIDSFKVSKPAEFEAKLNLSKKAFYRNEPIRPTIAKFG